MNRKGMLRAACLAAAAVLLLGAGIWLGLRSGENSSVSQKGRTAYGAADAVMMNATAAESASMDAGSVLSGADYEEDAGRKIIRTAQMNMDVGDLDAVLLSLQEQVSEAGGTIDYSEISGQKGEGRYASLEARVPSGLLDDFLAGTGSLGKVTRRVTQQSDMTAQYMDNASRLESARAQKQRLDELYAQAQDMSDIVEITDAIFEVQQEIDSLTGANAWIDERAAFARVSLHFTEAADGEIRIPFLTQLTESMKDGFEAIGGFFGALALFGAWALPWMALLALAALIVMTIRKHIRK